ncbi:hypothetical protein MFIFM68171_07071 [Madurella fahalii]|uniref:Uncharacterized protein n=1 Tax=Madurella fahalii TaxID=1157608 RepID=A0ABQ0GGG7_9PEZI
MKSVLLAILSLGGAGLVSTAPAPAGGYYPSPSHPWYPGPGNGGANPPWDVPKGDLFEGILDKGGPLIPWMCNCNNPATKKTGLEPLCAQSGGIRIPYGDGQICILSKALGEEVFTDANCRKEFGEGYNVFCAAAR